MHPEPHTFIKYLRVVFDMGGMTALRFPSLNLSFPLMLMADKKMVKTTCCVVWLSVGGEGSGDWARRQGSHFSQLQLLFTSNCQAAISEGDARCHPQPIFLQGIYQLWPQKH